VRYKPVIIGEAPGRDSLRDTPSFALMGSTGRNLCAIAGWDWDEYLRRTERVNLFVDPIVGKWSPETARRAAHDLLPLFRGRRVIVLGRKVAAAFGLDSAGNYSWMDFAGGRVMLVPHPSGRNRMWNDPLERAAAGDSLWDLLR
jgi:uracil-DNA glycosylase